MEIKSEEKLKSDLKFNKITLEEYTEAIKSNAKNIKKQKVKVKLIYYNIEGTNNKSLEKYTKSSCKDIFNFLN